MKHAELAAKFRLAKTPEGIGLVFTNEDYEAAAVALDAAGALAEEHAAEEKARLQDVEDGNLYSHLYP